MIKANELRLDNWVSEEVLGRVRVSAILPNIVEVVGKNMKTDGTIEDREYSISPANINPISLTPEILEACGFETDGRGWKKKENIFLQIQEHGQWVNGKPVSDIKYILYKGGAGAITQIQFVHQLQNLWSNRYIVTESLFRNYGL
jgi:hypothetical protein